MIGWKLFCTFCTHFARELCFCILAFLALAAATTLFAAFHWHTLAPSCLTLAERLPAFPTPTHSLGSHFTPSILWDGCYTRHGTFHSLGADFCLTFMTTLTLWCLPTLCTACGYLPFNISATGQEQHLPPWHLPTPLPLVLITTAVLNVLPSVC